MKRCIQLASGLKNGDLVLICEPPDAAGIVVVRSQDKRVGLPRRHLVPLSPLEHLATAAVG
jgi:hypothetical protein